MATNERHPIGLAELRDGTVMVVCDDGAVFTATPLLYAWQERTAIPGSPREEPQARELGKPFVRTR